MRFICRSCFCKFFQVSFLIGRRDLKRDFGVFIGESDFAKNARMVADSVKNNRATVLINGEKGSGKRTFAEFLHLKSSGCNFEGFTPLNSQDFESFFYSFNSFDFTDGALKNIFDEISVHSTDGKIRTVYIAQTDLLPFNLQNELLFYIKDFRQRNLEIRFIFGTESSLEEAVEKNDFSRDLYYLISTVCVNTVPLRNRILDIPLIARYFFEKLNAESGSQIKVFPEEEMLNFFWPGNVAELKNSLERAFILCRGECIKCSDLGITLAASSKNVIQGELEIENEDRSLKTAMDSFKKEYVTKVLEENAWNQTKTAKVLGIQRTYVIKLINELNIRRK